ncbi:capsule biosynthesis protein [Pontibaca salina]|uniref:Capsular biosynthesis protein n=1 Tax=Pontibaca salina TaxID=2795731 RepID=A0A934M1P8_9RHOB|nr:capsular biosynthesis protein [Pontibaca salina]MBI6629861.1 capsular biosynthesis protein [Pontibaca salina]
MAPSDNRPLAGDVFPLARNFLFLQGPHGPFFNALAQILRAAGASVWRIGFNAGDRAFWHHSKSYIPYRGSAEAWPDKVASLLRERRITDLVLYGDTRPIHAQAICAARMRGVTVHVFEEGYLRPYWVTYERGGSNGNSPLMKMSIEQMQRALTQSDMEAPLPPAHWGDMRHHIFYGALYHWFVMFRNTDYANFRPHRDLSVTKEFRLYLRRLLLMPAHAIERRVSTARIRCGNFPYHVALLQLSHDSSLRAHSRYSDMSAFLSEIVEGFAAGAPCHHHLVVKAHPLEDGRVNLRRELYMLARRHGIDGRVHYLRGGKLARLLDHARSAVTVNSTAGQQVLWRGIPLRAFGRAVYDKPELVSKQPLAEFFAAPHRPDNRAYKDFRRYLLETSQVPGGFYSTRARRQLLRQVVDLMLNCADPYQALTTGTSAPRQQFQFIR